MEDTRAASVLEESLIHLGLQCEDREEVLQFLGQSLLEKGYVKPGFIKALLEREREFPTGIPTGHIGVAIPHTDASYVNQTRMAVGILNHPVLFEEMGSDEGTVPVEIVLVLAISDSNLHLTFLQKLMSLFQKHDTLSQIKKAQTPQKVITLLQSIF